MSNVIKLNEKVVSLEELEAKKKEVATQKGVKLVEVSPNTYVTRIQG